MFVEGKPRTVFFPPDTLFTAFVATVQKIITYALGAHDPGSAQDGRTSNDFCTPLLVWCGKRRFQLDLAQSHRLSRVLSLSVCTREQVGQSHSPLPLPSDDEFVLTLTNYDHNCFWTFRPATQNMSQKGLNYWGP